jgi:hypothetical protein
LRKAFRRWYWWLPALLLTGAGLYVAYRATHPPWVQTEAWAKDQRLQVGMTLEEAESILGDRHEDGGWGMTWRAAWTIGDDRVGLEFSAFAFGQAGEKFAVIDGHEFHDPPIQRTTWWDHLRWRLGW